MKFRLLVLVFLALFALTACVSLADDVTPPPGYVAPAPAVTSAPLYPLSAPNPSAAQANFLQSCEPCHGATGMADGSMADRLEGVVIPKFAEPTLARQASPERWFQAISLGNMQNFMPPFEGSYTAPERWDLVAYTYTLSLTPEELQNGKALYQANCAGCHGEQGSNIPKADLSNQQFMASRSNQALFDAITKGVAPSMPAFDNFSEGARWDMTNYVRSLTLNFGAAFETVAAVEPATATPSPEPTAQPEAEATPDGEATEESTATDEASATQETPEAESTAEGTQGEATPTPEATAVAEIPEGTIVIRGQVFSSEITQFPAGATVTIKYLPGGVPPGHMSLNPSVLSSVPLDEQGNFVLSNVSVEDVAGLPSVKVFAEFVDDRNAAFVSEMQEITPQALTTNEFVLNVQHGYTSDTSGLVMEELRIFVEFFVNEQNPSEYQPEFVSVYLGSNTSNLAIELESPGIVFNAPANATSPLEVLDDGDPERYSLLSDKSFADLGVIMPGDYLAVYRYQMPYADQRVEVLHSVDLDVASVVVLVPSGVSVTGTNLIFLQEWRTGNEPDARVYNVYSSTGASLPAGATFDFAVSGVPTVTTPPITPEDDATRNLLFGAGALGITLILAGVWMYVRDRKAQQKADDSDDDTDFDDDEEMDDEESILDAIVNLDDEYRAGNISEEVYQSRRAALKDRLQKLL
jgi:mono/diheme cytochrome c family protein